MKPRANKGFSVAELMLGLALSAILAGFSVKGLQRLWIVQNEQILILRLRQALQLAREEALLKNRRMIVCPRLTKSRCGQSWEYGWIVKPLKGQAIRQFPSLWPGYRLKWHDGRASGRKLMINSAGIVINQGHFSYCKPGGCCGRWVVSHSGANYSKAALCKTELL